MDLPSRSWSISEVKRRDLSETVELMINPANIYETKPVTINTCQRVLGILDSLARLSKLGRALMLVPKAEQNYFLEQLNEENNPKKFPKSNQTACCVLSLHARKNIAFFLAILLQSETIPLPMEDFSINSRHDVGANITLFTDASGKPKLITDPDYQPTCLGVYRPQTTQDKHSTVRAFILPHSFLMGRDQYGHVYNDMALLEILPLFAEFLRAPAEYRGKTVSVYTDNQSTVLIFRKTKCKKIYLAYFLEALSFLLSALQIELTIKWLRRRSCFAAELADDATHAVFDNVEPGTICTRHALPAPLQEVMLETTSYHNHTLGKLRSRIKTYLLDIIPDLSFPH